MATTLEQLVLLLLAAITGLAVAFPLLKKGRRGAVSSVETPRADAPIESRLAELAAQKDALYSAIKEIEFDYKTGKLSSSDYQELESRYKAEAIRVLREEDEFKEQTPVGSESDEIERDIHKARKQMLVRDEVEKEASSSAAAESPRD